MSFHESTRVLTHLGYFPIRDLSNKRCVVWDGRAWMPAKVKCSPRTKPVFEVALSDGRSVICTSNQKWIIFDVPSRRNRLVRTSDLVEGMSLFKNYTYPDTDTVEMSFEEEEDAYTLGYLSYLCDIPKDTKTSLYIAHVENAAMPKIEKRLRFDHVESCAECSDFRCFFQASLVQKRHTIPRVASAAWKKNFLEGLFDCALLEDKDFVIFQHQWMDQSVRFLFDNENFVSDIQRMLETMGVYSMVESGYLTIPVHDLNAIRFNPLLFKASNFEKTVKKSYYSTVVSVNRVIYNKPTYYLQKQTQPPQSGSVVANGVLLHCAE